MSITLADIRTQSRQRADMLESQFVTDSELNSYINASMAELHDLLVAAYNEDYYMENVEFASVEGQIDYDIPDGTNYSGAKKFYKLRGMDVQVNNDLWTTCHRFNFNRRNEDQSAFAFNMLGLPYLEYRIVGDKVRFNRTPDANSNFRMFYNPAVDVLVNDTDAFDDINGYAEYVVVDAAIKMLQKEESDVQVLMAQKAALKARIEAASQNRDANEPESVTDIHAEDNYFYGFRR